MYFSSTYERWAEPCGNLVCEDHVVNPRKFLELMSSRQVNIFGMISINMPFGNVVVIMIVRVTLSVWQHFSKANMMDVNGLDSMLENISSLLRPWQF